MQAAAAVAKAFPPRGVIKLLAREHTYGDRPAIERLVAEEHILDTIRYFDGDRVECAVRLATGAATERTLNAHPGVPEAPFVFAVAAAAAAGRCGSQNLPPPPGLPPEGV
jgi:hypothetical protein